MDNNSAPLSPQPSRAHSIALVLTACSLSAVLAYLVFTRNFVFGSEPGQWVYPFLSSPPSIPLWIPLVVLLALGLFVFLGNRFILSHEALTLSGLFLAAIFIQSLLRRLYPFSLDSLVRSDRSNSFYTLAIAHSALEIISKFSALVSSFPPHARSNMPGKILLFELFRLFTSSPEVMGYLVIVVSTLGALLIYGISKRLFHDRRVAFYALTLYVLIPSKLVFFPILNTVTPVFMLLSLYLFVLYLDSKHFLIPWLLGVSFFLLVLFEPSPLVMGILMAGIALYAIREKRLSWKELFRLLAYSAVAFLAMSLIFYLLFSFNVYQSLLFVLNSAKGFNTRVERGYLIWIIENTKEFLYGAGAPVMIIFIYMVMLIIAEMKKPADWPLENVYVISLLVNFLVILFLGINRGEVTRLWIFLAAFFQIPAAVFIARIGKSALLLFLVAGMLAFQTMIALHRVGFVYP